MRTKTFARRVLTLSDSLPEGRSARVLAGQLGRAGTSVGANDRAACRSRSKAEMISKPAVVEEANEAGFWLELAVEHGLRPAAKVAPLQCEAGELTAIMVASRKARLARRNRSKIENRKSKI